MNAQQICTIARQIAKVPGFAAQSGMLLNAILAELCQEQDLDAAGKTFNFTLTPASVPIGNLNAQLASGPFKLPVDYLRTKPGNIRFFPSGLANFPLPLTPIDISEFDALVQQAGFQNFPVFWATDMSEAAPVQTVQAAVVSGSTTMQLESALSGTALSNGMGVNGIGIPVATTITYPGSGTTVTLSQPANATAPAAAYTFGICPIAYVWPPASGAYPCMVRYQSQMPDIMHPETSALVPWFPNQQFLITELSGRLMQLSGDDRWQAFLSADESANPSGSRVLLRRYLELKDDDTNRSKRVTLDRRRFGSDWSRLPKSKLYGY